MARRAIRLAPALLLILLASSTLRAQDAPEMSRVTDTAGGGYGFDGVMTMTLVQRAGGWKIFSGHASSIVDKRRARSGG